MCATATTRPAGRWSVGDEHGTVTDRGVSFSIDDQGFSELAPAPADAHYAIGWNALFGSGICTINCTFVASGLTLTQDAKFARSVAATGSFADSDFAVMPADQHGTYTIADHGRLQLTYADGRADTRTLTMFLDEQGRLDPGYGMLLNGALYTGPTFSTPAHARATASSTRIPDLPSGANPTEGGHA